MEIFVIVTCSLIPIFGIGGFIIGFNINATKKIGIPKKPKKVEKTEEQIMLERIENAHI